MEKDIKQLIAEMDAIDKKTDLSENMAFGKLNSKLDTITNLLNEVLKRLPPADSR
jgi:hypothetical protein